MKKTSHQEVKKLRVGTEPLLWGLAIFLLAVILVTANVRCYELHRKNLDLEEKLAEARTAIADQELRREQALTDRSEKLGLGLPDASRILVLHIRKDGNTEQPEIIQEP